MVEVMKIMATFLQKVPRTHCYTQPLNPAAGHCHMPLLETPGHSWASLGQSLVGLLLLSPGSWCTQSFVCALQESVSPVLWNCVIKSHWPPKSNSLGFSVPLPDPQVEKSIVGPRTFLTMQEFLWYNCSAVCGLSSHWLYSGANGDLLQEGLRHMPCVPGLLQPETLPSIQGLYTGN